jgi:hypothetical protein
VCLHVWCQILDLWLLAEILLGKAPSNNKGVSRRAEKSLVGTQYFFLVMSWRRKFWVLNNQAFIRLVIGAELTIKGSLYATLEDTLKWGFLKISWCVRSPS